MTEVLLECSTNQICQLRLNRFGGVTLVFNYQVPDDINVHDPEEISNLETQLFFDSFDISINVIRPTPILKLVSSHTYKNNIRKCISFPIKLPKIPSNDRINNWFKTQKYIPISDFFVNNNYLIVIPVWEDDCNINILNVVSFNFHEYFTLFGI